MTNTRTIVLTGDRDPFPVVFEMLGDVVTVEPGQSLRLVATGPDDAELTIGYGSNGVSVFRDPELQVDVIGPDGQRLDIHGF